MSLNKRQLMVLLAGLAASAAMPAFAQSTLDLAAARAVGEAYRAAHADEDFAAMRRALPGEGLNASAIDLVRRQTAADFRDGNVFVYQGWRLSRTEGRLFALLSA